MPIWHTDSKAYPHPHTNRIVHVLLTSNAKKGVSCKQEAQQKHNKNYNNIKNYEKC